MNISDEELMISKPSMESDDMGPRLIGDDFCDQIRALVKLHHLTYMDAVIHWCEKNGMEIDVGAELVGKSEFLKDKIEEEAERLNFIKKTNRLF